MFIYSGDHDRVVPTAGTEKWTRELGAELGDQAADFAPWWIDAPEFFGPQIGGYLSMWKGLAFATIRGAGRASLLRTSRMASQISRSCGASVNLYQLSIHKRS